LNTISLTSIGTRRGQSLDLADLSEEYPESIGK
jgi:hypothetical protein